MPNSYAPFRFPFEKNATICVSAEKILIRLKNRVDLSEPEILILMPAKCSCAEQFEKKSTTCTQFVRAKISFKNNKNKTSKGSLPSFDIKKIHCFVYNFQSEYKSIRLSRCSSSLFELFVGKYPEKYKQKKNIMNNTRKM